MVSLKLVGAVVLLVFVLAGILVIFSPETIFEAPPVTTVTVTSTTSEAAENATPEFEIGVGTTTYIPITIDSQTFTVKATNDVFPLFGVTVKAPAVSFTEAGKIAYKAAGLNTLEEIKLEYSSENMIYTVVGHAKDSFFGFDTENLRIVTISSDGNVLSITKEMMVFSFFRNLFSSTIGLWKK